MKLSIIVPTFNGKSLLEQFLPQIVQESKTISETEIIIVDNGSSDDTATYVKKTYPEISYIQLPDNTGFTGASNAGAECASGEYLLFLNNDCFVTAESIHAMLNFLATKSEYCATQPVIYNTKKQIENIGFYVNLPVAKAHVITSTKSQYFSRQTLHWNNVHSTVYGLSGTCLLIERKTFIDIGMFDTSFHSYLEDVDLALRLMQKGKQVYPTLTASAVHKHMSTSSRMGVYKQKRDFINWILIIAKRYPFPYILSHMVTLGLERLRNLNGVLKKLLQ